MKHVLLSFMLALPMLSNADTVPSGYSSDLLPVMRRVVAQVFRGMWGREPEPPDRVVMEVLPMFHFHRIDLNRDGSEEVIATTGEPPNTPNGDIFIFQRAKNGWSIIGDFDGYGGYTVTDEVIAGYRTIRTQHADDPATYKTFHQATYRYRDGRYQASTPKERSRDASRK